MSQTLPIAAPTGAAAPARPDVRGAIASASAATGVDFGFLLGQARLESSLDPAAHATGSSAAGLFQFTSGTWLAMLDRHGAANGLGWASDAIVNGRIADPALRRDVLALRHDPQVAALMAGELAAENRQALTGVLGREPDASELYLAHFLGAEGAGRFLAALAADPSQSAAALLPKAAAANRGTFYAADGAPRSLGEVMGLLRGRMTAAMDGGTSDGFMVGGTSGAGLSPGASLARRWSESPAAGQPPRSSMADTLADAFGSGGADALPVQVRAAYGKLRAFGL